MLTGNTFTGCAWLLIVVFLAACGSDGYTTPPINTMVTVAADSSFNEDPANGGTGETGVESGTVDPVPVESETADPNPEAVGSNIEQPIANNQGVNFGAAKLLVDLVPNGDSYPDKFHLAGDNLYFWTVDTDPRFARCAYHWSNLSDADKSVSFNIVAMHPETGVVAMNKEMMTLGDFAENANGACAGYNGSVMHVYKQTWITESVTGEQQFALHFDSKSLGPDMVWTTDGSEANTSLLDTGLDTGLAYFEGDKVFFIDRDALSVSDKLSGDRRILFNRNESSYYESIKRIVTSPARQATFEITVGENRSQIWTYNLDTDEWVKTFNIKPDSSVYRHHETLLVDGPTLLSMGERVIGERFIDRISALGLSSTFGDVTSFELLSESEYSIRRANGNSNDRLAFTTTDFSVEPKITSVWIYSDERIEQLFSFSELEPGLQDMKVIAGYDGRIYVSGIRTLQEFPGLITSLELLSYDPQTNQLVELSGDDWFAEIFGHPTLDEGYFFRYLSTPDGLVFVNLKEDSGRELWLTDGTHAGTRQLADINPGVSDSDPRNFYYSGDAIYFSADDGTHGREPWMIPISR